MLRYVVDNARWCINRQYFIHLLGEGMTTEQLDIELNSLSCYRHCDSTNAIAVNNVRFALNDIAMAKPKHQWWYHLHGLLPTYWAMFVALSRRLRAVHLPSYDGRARIDAVVELYMRATQNHNDMQLWTDYVGKATRLLVLTPRELAYIDDLQLLYRCMYYCAVCRHVDISNSDQYLYNISDSCPLVGSMVDNNRYSNTAYSSQLQTVIDCFGASAVMLGGIRIDNSMSIDISANGRNVLDTFCQHLYGDKMSLYRSSTNSITASMRYSIRRCSEIRTIDIVGGVRSRQRYDVRVHVAIAGKVQNFVVNNCNCMCVGNGSSYYVSYVLVDDNYRVIDSTVTDCGKGVSIDLVHSVVMDSNQSSSIHVVSIYGNSVRDITQQLEQIQLIGYCSRMPLECEVVEGRQYDISTNVTASSNMYTQRNIAVGREHNYTYQFGDNSVSTLLDNDGNGCTMLDGFVFGGGEKVYYYTTNKISPINCGKFAIDASGYSYMHSIGDNQVQLRIEHRNAKVYSVTMPSNGGALFVLPFEQHSVVKVIDNGFEIVSNARHFTVRYSGRLDSFTTNSIECSSRRLRRHLSGDVSTGDSLVMSFVGGGQLDIEICNCNKLPVGRAIVRQSLLSTYLNYINNKNIYLAVNRLRPMQPLVLASMVYTNANYVWQYLLDMEKSCTVENGLSYYYDSGMSMVSSGNSMTYPLALLYYVTVTGNKSVLTPERIGRLQYMLYDQQGNSQHMCLVALALRKLAKLNIDKVTVLIQYSNVKKAVCSNKDSYGYAQAIGAVPLVNASKQRLKSLVAIHDIPKCFYYVSQLENLYGIELVGDRLLVQPRVTSGLEQLLLNVGNRHIDTTFDSNGKSLSINGCACNSGIDVSLLEANSDNTLVVGCSKAGIV